MRTLEYLEAALRTCQEVSESDAQWCRLSVRSVHFASAIGSLRAFSGSASHEDVQPMGIGWEAPAVCSWRSGIAPFLRQWRRGGRGLGFSGPRRSRGLASLR